MTKQINAQPQFELIAAAPTVTLTAKGVSFSDKTTLEQWQDTLTKLARVNHVSGFMIGDALNFGASKFTKKEYKSAMAATGLTYGTLRTMASVAARFPETARRHALSFEHHRLLAPLKKQEKVTEIMDRVENENLSSAAMRELIPKAKAKKLSAEAQEKKDAAKNQKMLAAGLAVNDWLSSLKGKQLAHWTEILHRLKNTVDSVLPDATKALAEKQAKDPTFRAYGFGGV